MGSYERGMVADPVREIPYFTVKYKDVFSLQNLYVMMHEMLLEENWLGYEGKEDHADLETLYSENVYQTGLHSGGKETWIWWRVQKHQEGRYSQYFRNILDIDWHVVYSKVQEVVYQGKKVKAQAGELEMFFKPKILGDVGHGWQKNFFLRTMKPFYEGRMMSNHLDTREKELWRDVYRMQSKVKAYLNLKTWMPTPDLFHPKKWGWEGEF